MAENIVIKVTGDATGLKTVKDELVNTGKVTDDVIKKFDNLNNSIKDTENEFKSLKTQLREAKTEAQLVAQQFGFNSKEAKQAQMKVAELSDQMDDFNNRVKALDPEKKFNAFTSVLGTTAGAFQGLTGMMRLFGGESKEATALVNKLTGVMMFAQGINSLFAMKDALKDIQVVLGITTVATKASTIANQELAVAETEAAVASKGLTASLLTNPAFLIIAGIAALGAAIYAMGDDTEEATKKVDLMTESQKALRDATNSTADAADRLAVAQGSMSSTRAQINKTYRDTAAAVEDINEKIKDNNNNINENNKVIRKVNQAYDEAQKRMATRRADLREEVSFQSFVNDEYIKAVKANQELAQTNKDLVGSINEKNKSAKITVDLIKEEEKIAKADEAKKAAEKRSAENKRIAEERKRELEQQLKLAEQVKKQLQKNAVDEEKDPLKKIELQKQFANENYAFEVERLQNAKASQNEIDLLSAQHTDLISNLSAQEVKINQEKNDKILLAEQKLNDSRVALKLKQESDPVKQAQIEMDALDDKYAKILSNEKLTATERETYNNEYLKAQLDITDKVTKATVDAEKVKQDAAKKTADDQKKLDEEKLKTAIATKDALINGAQEFASMGFSLTKDRLDAESTELEKQKEKGLISEEEYQKKVNQIKRKQALADKQQAIFNATLNFASAMINALNMTPTTAVPAQLILTAAIAGANLARIIATPLPKYQKGTLSVPGIDMGTDSVHALLQPGEAVIPTSINKKYAPTIKAIYEQKISPKDINAFVKGNKSGSQELLATVDTYALGRVINKNRNVNIENAETLGKIIANEIGSKFNARNII